MFRFATNIAGCALFLLSIIHSTSASVVAKTMPPPWQEPPTALPNPFDSKTTSQFMKICIIGGAQSQESSVFYFDAPDSANVVAVVRDGLLYDQIWTEMRRVELPTETSNLISSVTASGVDLTRVSDMRAGIVTGSMPFADCDFEFINVVVYSFRYSCDDGSVKSFVCGLPLSRSSSDVQAIALADLAYNVYEDLIDWWLDFPGSWDTLPSGAPMPTSGGIPSQCVDKLGARPTTAGLVDPCDFAAAEYAQCMWDARCKFLLSMKNATATTRSGFWTLVGGVAGAIGTGAVIVCTGGSAILVVVPALIGGVGVGAGIDSVVTGSEQTDIALQIYNSEAAACFKQLYNYFSLPCE